MRAAVMDWAGAFFLFNGGHARTEVVHSPELHLRIELERRGIYPEGHAARDLLSRPNDDAAGLDLIDFCLGLCIDHTSKPRELSAILARAGSAWMVGSDPDGYFWRGESTRRCTGKFTEEMAAPGNAAIYLKSAWHFVYGRDPSTSSGYRDADRAVEAAARPLIAPNDNVATLGK